MLPVQQDSATKFLRDIRRRNEAMERPSTPEMTGETAEQPLSPRAVRLRVRRRNPRQPSAPTDHFLASIAAFASNGTTMADVPIPTIELPNGGQDEDMPDVPDNANLAANRSPPRTPLPRLLTSSGNSGGQRRNWYVEDTPEQDGASRPSSAVSDWSDDSSFGGRIPQPSEAGSCTSPESDGSDAFEYPPKASSSDGTPSKSKASKATKDREGSVLSDSSNTVSDSVVPNAQRRSKKQKNAPWSSDMSDHLWSTYQVYLQDPTVTPFRVSANAMPPEGVVHRVAREAKRSWRGQRAVRRLRIQRMPSLSINATLSNNPHNVSPDGTGMSQSGGSLTPTGARSPRAYPGWPHSGAATRSHLRELCRRRGFASAQTHRHLQSRSPTPFTQENPRLRDRHRSPSASRSTFSTRDIALSLTTSSAESMRPDGPLATLGNPRLNPSVSSAQGRLQGSRHTMIGRRNVTSIQWTRLGSPFSSHTYGPSSSRPAQRVTRSSIHTQANATMPFGSRPLLQSPVHLDQPRSLNSTQKRRAQHSLEEEMGTGNGVRQSDSLDQLFDTTSDGIRRRVRSRGFSLGEEPSRGRTSGPLGLPDPFIDTRGSGRGSLTYGSPRLLPSAEFGPSGLSSPPAEEGTPNTFPRRLLQSMGSTSTVRRQPFATVHYSRHSVESLDSGAGPALETRLRHLDQKLAEIREREPAPRSPPRD